MRDQKEILNIFIGRTREANQVLFQSLAYQIPTETSSNIDFRFCYLEVMIFMGRNSAN